MCYWLVLFYAGVSLDMGLWVIQGKSYHTYIKKWNTNCMLLSDEWKTAF